MADLGELVPEELRHAQVVVLPVQGHAQERRAVGIAVGRIEIEIAATVGHVAHLRFDAAGMQVVLFHRRLPGAAPLRRALRQRNAAHRSVVGLPPPDHAAADEVQRAMVEIVAVKIIDCLADAAGSHELIDIDRLVEEQVHAIDELVTEVAADRALARLGIVGRADARRQHQPHVVEMKSRQHDHPGRLLDLAALGIDVGDADRFLPRAVDVDLGDVGAGSV